MAYNLTDEELLEKLITDPAWCLFYHRERVKRLLPFLARSYMLIEGIKIEVSERLKLAEGGPDG